MGKELIKCRPVISNEKGAVAIMVGLSLVVLIGFLAFAFDLQHHMAAKSALQNAADAGALAGARSLFNENGASINTGCNQVAYNIATANYSEKVPVEVLDHLSNNGDVQRGHWSFINNEFTPNPSTTVLDFWNDSSEELDVNTNFINAVRVVTRRSGTPIAYFFEFIFGRDQAEMSAEAVAWMGFAAPPNPADLDQPIAICRQSIVTYSYDEEGNPVENLECNMGRMINSGNDPLTSNTGAWTNLTQPCSTASASWMSSLICSDLGELELPDFVEGGVGATGGNLSNIMRQLQDCWVDSYNIIYDEDGDEIDSIRLDTLDDSDTIPERPWILNLLVVDCPGNNVSNCPDIMATVRIEMLWILDNQNTNQLSLVPYGQDGAVDVPYVMYYDPYGTDPDTDGFWDATDIPSGNDCSTVRIWNSDTQEYDIHDYSDEFQEYLLDFPDQPTLYDPDNPVHRFWYFVTAFDLRNQDGSVAPYQNMAMYFTPRCDYGEQAGGSSSDNFGILAKIPKLVK